MEKTVFMKMIDGDIPKDFIYEDEYTAAFLDISPNAPGHTLVIPKKPIVNVFDADEETFAHVMETVRKLAPVIRDAVGADGVNINSNHGEYAGQVVFHMHIHIIPRFKDDGLKFTWPKGTLSPEEGKELTARIREKLS
jgi:histidine triad (HIT) family protein